MQPVLVWMGNLVWASQALGCVAQERSAKSSVLHRHQMGYEHAEKHAEGI